MRNTLTLLLMLSGTWFLLSGHTHPLLLTLGLISVVAVIACTARLGVLDDEGMPVQLLPGLIRYVPWLAGQVIRSNLDVARRIINPKLPISPSVIHVDAKRHPNLISVSEYFEANSTLYMVMTHEEGRDLRWFINKLAGELDWNFLQQVFPPIGDGLWRMHQQGVVHLDVKPANVLLRTSGQPLLLDFGAAQTMDNDDRFGSFQTLTHGFAPPEQYLDGDLGPWTDIYGLAATIYNCITGASPPPALKRRDGASLEKLSVSRSGAYPYTLLKAVEDALSLDQGQRPHDMHAFLSLAFGAASHTPAAP